MTYRLSILADPPSGTLSSRSWKSLSWPVAHGPDIGPDMLVPERINSDEVVQVGQLCDATMLQ